MEMPDDEKKKLACLVRDWGMIGVVRALAGFCGHWSRHYDQSPATREYALVEAQLHGVADHLERMTNAS